MKKVSVLIAAMLLGLAAGEVILAGVDAPTWNAARKKFLRGYKDADKLPGLIDELGELDDRRAVEMLCKKTLFHDDFDIRVQTFDALVTTTDPEAVKYLAEQVRRDEKNRLIYARLLQYVSGDRVVENIKRALRDKRWEVVSAALEAARRHADKSLLDALKQKLNEKNARLAYEAALAYEACGGEIPARFKLKAGEGIFPEKIFSNKCLILFDTSDDMAIRMALPPHALKKLLPALKKHNSSEYKKLMNEEEKGKKTDKYDKYCVWTRQSYCAKMTVDALLTLGDSSEVNIMRYSVGTALWQRKKFKKLGKKDEKSIRKFIKDVMTQPARDLYDALRRAMRIEDIDTIFIVTCGLPAGARVEDTDQILSWLNEVNYERAVRIHTTVVLSEYRGGSPTDEYKLAYQKAVPPILEFYKKIAQQNGGQFYSLTHLGKVPLSAATAQPSKEEPKKEEPKKEEPKKEEPKKEEPKKKPKDDEWLPGGR
jgi:hypothetical protein